MMVIEGTEDNVEKIEPKPKDKAEFPTEHKPLYISTKLIRLNPFNPRTESDRESDAQLLKSIKIKGVETPIHVRPLEAPDENGAIYEIYDGDRRFRAALKARIAKVPVLILSKTDDEVMEFGITSQIRRGLSDVELGRAFVELLKRFSYKYKNQRDLAYKLVMWSPARINQMIKLVTDLDPEVQDLVAPADQSKKVPEGAIQGRMAYEISLIPEKERQREVAHEIVSKPELKGDRARLLIKEAREEPETPISEITSRRLADLAEPTHISMVMTREDYERIKEGKQRLLVRRHRQPGLGEDAIVDPLLKADEPLEISDVFRRPLGRFNESDAKNAGFKDLATFKESWIQEKGSNAEWDPQEYVEVILFKQQAKKGG